MQINGNDSSKKVASRYLTVVNQKCCQYSHKSIKPAGSELAAPFFESNALTTSLFWGLTPHQ